MKMKKKIIFIILSLITTISYSQKELWGVNTGSENNINDPSAYYGNITKYDINGENPVMIHEFDLTYGAIPKGRLFLASNGKLYGTTVYGGNFYENGGFNVYAGVLFEYDLILEKYRVVHYFDNTNPEIVIANPYIGVLEPVQGILVGATYNRVYKYDLATENMTFSNPTSNFNGIHNELTKASNGFIYGTSYYEGPCQSTSDPGLYLGNIIKYDIATNILTFAHSINCTQESTKGSLPNSELIEVSPGKLIGVTKKGGNNYIFSNPLSLGGTIYEFNINTNVFTKKIDFDYATNGMIPNSLVNGGNSKIYGLCENGGVSSTGCNSPNPFGTLYEYTPGTNTFEVKQNFAYCNNETVQYPTSLMKTSVGHYIGTNGLFGTLGLFKYDATTNTTTMCDYTGITDIHLIQIANLIEICRKPSYQEIVVNTFDTCEGSSFTYDIQNTNATSYQWQQNGIDVAGQTTGVLNLTNITTSDAGNYTCVMTNECGTTTTMVLHLTVNCLGTTTIANFEESVNLYPNPTNGVLNIDLPTNIDVNITSLKVINLLGQEILVSNTNTTKIDVSSLPIGIYILSLQTNYGNWNGKFIKH